MNEDKYLQEFDEIIAQNDFDFSDVEDGVEAEILESTFSNDEVLELNYVMAAVMQQIAGLMIDFENEDDPGWLDEDGTMLLRSLKDICEEVIDRTFDNDCECDE